MLNHTVSGANNDVVFLHGWGGGISSFCGLQRGLLKHCRCLNLDFYGHGQSSHGAFALTLDDFACGVRELFDRHEITDATLIAHSFGARVAIKLAGDERVKRLVLIGAAGLKKRRSLVVKLKILRYKLGKFLGADVSGMGSPDWQRLSAVERATFTNIINEDLKPLLCHIKKPTLLIWGAKDTETPLYTGKIMERLIPDCGLVVFENAGHFVYLEHEAECIDIINSFMEVAA